ncbi:MAG: hypothetical protein HC897_06245 [Thermoanaerobaculia bacterium]|nr:hypothetical protein [Thermoanaerobaculia bacterium]
MLASFDGEPPYARVFSAGGEIFVWRRAVGLSRLRGDVLERVAGGEALRERRVDQVLPAREGLLVSVRQEGLFLLRAGMLTPFAPEASAWAREHRVYNGTTLPDGRWVLGSLLGGILLLRSDGTIEQVIDAAAGLPDDFVSDMALDHEGALWLALNNGLARIAIDSPISVLDRRSGLPGAIYNAARHRGRLWVAAAAGLYRGDGMQMRMVEGIPPSAWSLLSVGDDLLVGAAGGVFAVPDDGAASGRGHRADHRLRARALERGPSEGFGSGPTTGCSPCEKPKPGGAARDGCSSSARGSGRSSRALAWFGAVPSSTA